VKEIASGLYFIILFLLYMQHIFGQNYSNIVL